MLEHRRLLQDALSILSGRVGLPEVYTRDEEPNASCWSTDEKSPQSSPLM
jgi:hypothetical protein